MVKGLGTTHSSQLFTVIALKGFHGFNMVSDWFPEHFLGGLECFQYLPHPILETTAGS
jgi:hypothetical protein